MAKQRSWPLVFVGAGIALLLGALIWVFWLGPGQPTVKQQPSSPPLASETNSPQPTATQITPTTQATAGQPSDTPTDEINNPIDDAIVGYPGKPIGPSQSVRDVVKVVQQRLADIGISVTVDGIYGNRTQNAVKNFQKNSGLPVTGIVDRNTWAALFTSEG
ncbi:unannotated protein [freshwater metagenome]|jgi:hypothetical protein|uniref:Unannotated protein n=1 Tax=freshwater metagenome TaxID=449393 RepID=A0A6J7D749_9ZZZZ|nr:hypothetical protein [Actinomycetota bacterium]